MDKSEPSVVEANVGERVRLPCTVEASPALTIEWQKDGQPLSSPRWAPGWLHHTRRQVHVEESLLFALPSLSPPREDGAAGRAAMAHPALCRPAASGRARRYCLSALASLTDQSLNAEPSSEQLWYRVCEWAKAEICSSTRLAEREHAASKFAKTQLVCEPGQRFTAKREIWVPAANFHSYWCCSPAAPSLLPETSCSELFQSLQQ